MRLYEFASFLFEYKRDITQQTLGDKLVNAAQRDQKQDINTILDALEQSDPSKKKQYVEWLARQYISGQFRLEDYPRINDVLTKFEHIKNKLQQKDINKYTFRSLEDAIDKEYNVELASDSDDKPVVSNNIPDVKVLYNGPLGNLSIPETEEASKMLGKGTKWCTAADKNNMFSYYSNSGPLYIWRDKSGEKYQFHFESLQFMDDKDDPIEHELLMYMRSKHPVLSKLFNKEEAKIAVDSGKSYEYAETVLDGRFEAGEAEIIKYPALACDYAIYIIKGRWPDAEEAIAVECPDKYIEDVLDGRRFKAYEDLLIERDYTADAMHYMREHYIQFKNGWPELEESILAVLYSSESAMAAVSYAIITGRRWTKAEDYIANDPLAAAKYAKKVIGGAWPEGEKSIASDSNAAFDYARYVVGPFPAGEKEIASSSEYSFRYATEVLHARFPAGEAAINSDSYYKHPYEAKFHKPK